ncbi:hypothetical protein D3C81_1473810 [compost metagenome]
MTGQHCCNFTFTVPHRDAGLDAASFHFARLSALEQPGADHAIGMAIADAVVVFQVAFVLWHAVLFQVGGCGTEHQALGTEVLVAKCGRPGIRATDSHHDVDTFVHRVDKTVGERHVRLQQWVQADEVQNQGQHMQAAVGGWQFYPDLAMGFVVAGDQCVLDLFQVGQDRGAGTVEDDASLAERQGACGAVE